MSDKSAVIRQNTPNPRFVEVAAYSALFVSAAVFLAGLMGMILGGFVKQLNAWALNNTVSAWLLMFVLGAACLAISAYVVRTNRKDPAKLRHIARYRYIYLMLIPGALYYLVFKFLPVLNLKIVFQVYSPTLQQQERVSWQAPLLMNFTSFFSNVWFWKLLRNTLILALLNITFYFPFPIIMALLLNEIKHMGFKRISQSVLYLPHFVSWTVLGSLMIMLLGPEPNGLVNSMLKNSGSDTIPFMMSEAWFRPLYIIELIWKESGWGTIIYLAALSGVDEQLYEAAVIDGAGRFKQLLHITLPSILPTIVTLLILRMGSFLDSGFDQIYLMLNSSNREVATVFDTYVYDMGLAGVLTSPVGTTNYSYSATIGVFRSVVSLVLVMGSNAIAKAAGEDGVY